VGRLRKCWLQLQRLLCVDNWGRGRGVLANFVGFCRCFPSSSDENGAFFGRGGMVTLAVSAGDLGAWLGAVLKMVGAATSEADVGVLCARAGLVTEALALEALLRSDDGV